MLFVLMLFILCLPRVLLRVLQGTSTSSSRRGSSRLLAARAFRVRPASDDSRRTVEIKTCGFRITFCGILCVCTIFGGLDANMRIVNYDAL